ncbi:Y132A [Hepatospora eriocheir]|uniref:Y132A n=1 Tax=Hepatospora eriocheir TaxID=1081669 RepID=A0A1X0Q7R4_9MICR|nr:Y132A [Hepatospora eriocheir]
MKIIDLLQRQYLKHAIENPLRLGGDGMVVQIDESLFRHKQKYYRCRQPEKEIQAFGLADVSFTPAKISLHVVPNRAASTLLPIIEEVCLPGSVIYSDEWRACARIGNSNFRFSHFTVNHSETFVNHQTGVYTQNIESVWNKCKYVQKIYNG